MLTLVARETNTLRHFFVFVIGLGSVSAYR